MNLTTALTIIGSIGAASTAQIVNHILSQRREDKKYYKECLQNLYSPLILKFIEFIKSEGFYHGPNDFISVEFENRKILFNKIMDVFDNNLKYADAELINNYQELRDFVESIEINNLNNQDTETFWILIMNLTNTFFEQYIKINKLLKLNSKSINEKLYAPYFFSHFYLLIKDCTARDDMSYDEIFSFYDLIEFVLLPINDYTERIIKIRKELSFAWYQNMDQQRTIDAFSDACQLLYEIAYEACVASPDRANDFKDSLDERIY